MKTSAYFKATSRTLCLALLLTTPAGLLAADETTSRTVSGETARDRNDTIRSNETRINTTGRDVSAEDASKLSRGDRRFIEKAAARSDAEIRAAKLAAERATDPRVRSFAQQVATDHEKARTELHALAGRKGVSLEPENHNERIFRMLSDKSGTDFDKRFMAHLNDEHGDDIEMFEKAARKSDDPDVAAFASKQLPVLQQHHTQGMELETTITR